MEELWTPWRMRYITAPAGTDGCVFCRIAARADDDLVLARGASCFTVLNRYPYSVGHAMVIPFRHLGRLADLRPEEADELTERSAGLARILRHELGAHRVHYGINLGRPAGAGVEGHLHLHLVPLGGRIPLAGPGLDLPVPLAQTAAQLRAALADASAGTCTGR